MILSKIFFITILQIIVILENKNIINQEILGYTMGTKYHIKILDKKKIKENQNLSNILKKINKNMSNYNIKSNLYITNKKQNKSPIIINKITNFNISNSIKIKKKSNYYFNVNFNKFKSKKKNKLINSQILKNKKNNFIDLSAITKGYTIDKIYEKFKKNYNSLLIEIGGEIKVSEKKNKNKKWQIAINIPFYRKNNIILKIKNKSLATSGTYLNYINDKLRYSHIINNKTKKNLQKDRLLSSSIISKDCFLSDSLATISIIIGEKKTSLFFKNIIKKYFLIYKNKNKIYIVTNKKGKKKLKT